MNTASPSETPVRVPVESLKKGLDLLEMLCQPGVGEEGVALAILAERMSWKRSTTHNLLKTLCLCGVAENIGDGRYRAGWKVQQLGRWVLFGDAGLQAVGAVAADVSVTLGEAVVVAVLVNGRRRVVARASGTQVIRVDSTAADGVEKPLWHTVTGRVLAAFCSEGELAQVLRAEGMPAPGLRLGCASPQALAESLAGIRAAGVAEDQASGVASLAVPVLSGNGALLAALGTYLPGFRYGPGLRGRLLQALGAGAERLREALGQEGPNHHRRPSRCVPDRGPLAEEGVHTPPGPKCKDESRGAERQ